MKNIYSLILLLFVFAFSADAQQSFTFTSAGNEFVIVKANNIVSGAITLESQDGSEETIEIDEKISIQPNEKYIVKGAFTKLNIASRELTSLDVSGLTNLTQLDCNANNIMSLDVSMLTKLKILKCFNNKLETLDVSGLNNLTNLYCNDNELIDLDISSLKKLKIFNCNKNKITSLVISGLVNLTHLYCNNNNLPSLVVSGMNDLKELKCNNNQIKELNVSGFIKLTHLYCDNNELLSLDVSGLTNLINLHCDYNQIKELNVSELINLTHLHCSSNKLLSLDVSNLTKIKEIFCEFNQLVDIKTSVKVPDNFKGIMQKNIIPMKKGEKGKGFISTSIYDIEDGHKLTFASDVTGISFKNGFFKSVSMPKGDKGFGTDVGYGSDKKLSGVLVFEEDPNAGIMDFTLNTSKEKQFNIKVYPNPVETNREITVEYNLNPEQYKDAVINVYSVLGVLTQSIKVEDNKTNFVIPNQGVYFVHFKSTSFKDVKKIIVK